MALDAGHVMVNCRSLTLGDQLGRGSSGTVTHAQDPATGLIVALKVVPITLRTGAEQVCHCSSRARLSLKPGIEGRAAREHSSVHYLSLGARCRVMSRWWHSYQSCTGPLIQTFQQVV